MSAFICSDRHIATIAVRYAELTENTDPQDIADRLKAINIASVNYRYDGDTPITPCDLSEVAPPDYQFPDLVALCDCLDYQSCELPDYSNPLLEAITAQFKANCLHNIQSPVWSI
jgi:hypothetical protein